jgi:hypothetical protein
MLSSCLFKKPIYKNNTIQDYCRKSTQMSIAKLTEKYNLERNKPKIKNPLANNNREFNIYNFIIFLSISSITFYFYKRLC